MTQTSRPNRPFGVLPSERNPGTPLDTAMFDECASDETAIERRAAELRAVGRRYDTATDSFAMPRSLGVARPRPGHELRLRRRIYPSGLKPGGLESR